MSVITEDWTVSDVRKELLKAKEENRVPTYREPHLLYNVKTNPTLKNIEKFISIVGEEGYNMKLKDVDNILKKRNYF